MDSGHIPSGGGQFAPAFGGFMNDQTAQMGFQIGKSAAMAGQEYMEQNVSFDTRSTSVESSFDRLPSSSIATCQLAP